MAKEFTDGNFQSEVLAADKLTVVDFWAEWCGPCRAIGPVIEDLAKEYNGKINVGKVNVDVNPNISMNYGITSIPAILFFKNGQLVDKLVGAQPVGDTGILTITVYHPSRLQAESLASAIAQVFASKGALFHGVGDRITIRTIDDPVTSEKPVSPILWLNALIAFIVASGAAMAFRMHAVAQRHVQGKVQEEEYFLR